MRSLQVSHTHRGKCSMRLHSVTSFTLFHLVQYYYLELEVSLGWLMRVGMMWGLYMYLQLLMRVQTARGLYMQLGLTEARQQRPEAVAVESCLSYIDTHSILAVYYFLRAVLWSGVRTISQTAYKCADSGRSLQITQPASLVLMHILYYCSSSVQYYNLSLRLIMRVLTARGLYMQIRLAEARQQTPFVVRDNFSCNDTHSKTGPISFPRTTWCQMPLWGGWWEWRQCEVCTSNSQR